MLYLCTVAPGPVTISHEAVAAGYLHPEDVDEWHANHQLLACWPASTGGHERA